MKTLLIIDENGKYKNNNNERCKLLCCEWVKGERADEFQEFDNTEQAMEAYGVEEYHEPVIAGAIDVPVKGGKEQ